MVDLKTLRQLIKLMQENDLTELDLSDKEGEKIRVKRGGDAAQSPVYMPAPQPAAPPPPAAAPPAPAAVEEKTPASAGLIEIKSPMVGTYYSAPSPDAAVFVSPGSKVGDETVVCIIEAMKVFNEIKAETKGTIEKVLVENGAAVEFGQPLFLVKP